MTTDEEMEVEIEDKREMVNNLRKKEDIVFDMQMEEPQPLKANQQIKGSDVP